MTANYFDTTHMAAHNSAVLAGAQLTAASQNDRVLAIFRASKIAMSPSQVLRCGPRDDHGDLLWLIGSVRRSMTVLAQRGELVKGGLVPGPHGMPEHEWRLPS